MKFFLVISIIAFWWVPTNSPGNIGMISKSSFDNKLIPIISLKNEEARLYEKDNFARRKMDHFGDKKRKTLLKKLNKKIGN